MGLVYYRAGRFRDALTVLLPNVKTQKDANLPFDLLLLAMAYHQLGDRDQARSHLELAHRWNQSVRTRSFSDDQDFAALRAEAEALIEQ
jgi:hypothetical protein